ncbi:MAG: hypothetical protein WCV72_03710 [Patescibacteria group bacterium]|jgi:hypothetical protein
MKKFKNTYRKGILTFISYKTKENTFVAACEELCVLVEEKDAELAKLKAMAQTKSYLENVVKQKLGQHLLNQSLPREIKKEFLDFLKKEKAERWESSIERVIKENGNKLCAC